MYPQLRKLYLCFAAELRLLARHILLHFFPGKKLLFCNDASPHVKTRPRSVSRFPLSPRRPSVPKSSLGTTDSHPGRKGMREERWWKGRRFALAFSHFVLLFSFLFSRFGLFSLALVSTGLCKYLHNTVTVPRPQFNTN